MKTVFIPCAGVCRYNDHLHVDFFIRAFRQLGYKVLLYGPEAGVRATRLGVKLASKFIKDRPIGEVVSDTAPDVYFSNGPQGSSWQSHHRVKLDIPKILYQADLHYAKSGAHFAGGSALIVRTKRNADYVRALPGGDTIRGLEWLPFSVSTVLPPATASSQAPKVAFAGAPQAKFYPVRAGAIAALKASGLITTYIGYMKYAEYLSFLRRHMAGLACSSKWRLDVAKHVEIPASGSLLMTDGLARGINEMFAPDMYVTYTPQTAVKVAREIISDRPAFAAMAERARRHVELHHTDAVRANQFGEILRRIGC